MVLYGLLRYPLQHFNLRGSFMFSLYTARLLPAVFTLVQKQQQSPKVNPIFGESLASSRIIIGRADSCIV